MVVNCIASVACVVITTPVLILCCVAYAH